jgi:hypothetical protein
VIGRVRFTVVTKYAGRIVAGELEPGVAALTVKTVVRVIVGADLATLWTEMDFAFRGDHLSWGGVETGILPVPLQKSQGTSLIVER